MHHADQLLHEIEASQAVVGVIGLGYVGLPLAHALHAGGLTVLGFDNDASKVRGLERGENHLAHLGHELAQTLAASERFNATSDFGLLRETDVVIVCVPTPLGPHQEPDLSYVLAAARLIGRTLRAGQLVVLASTTYPGTTRDEFLPALLAASSGELVCGRDFFVAYSPEREDPGSEHRTKATPKLVAGMDAQALRLAAALYRKGIEHVIEVSSPEVAEAAKLHENIFRSVNIALVNELKVILDAMGVDVWEVIEAASSKPFGFMPFQPGPGLGGHCIPIDPFYLAWKARAVGRPTRFVELAGAINRSMPGYVIERLMLALNERGRALREARILILGLAYKPNIDDTRESPSFELIVRLRELGAVVDYSDPHIPVTRPTRKVDLRMHSKKLSAASIASYDALVIATDHDAFDWELVAQHADVIVDTRNAMRPYEDRIKGLLVRA